MPEDGFIAARLDFMTDLNAFFPFDLRRAEVGERKPLFGLHRSALGEGKLSRLPSSFCIG